jgi:hypothetical protein
MGVSRIIRVVLLAAAIGALTATAATANPPIHGPLRVSQQNPRYFADATGRAVFLTGTHTWNDLVDESPASSLSTLPRFEWDRYLQFLQENHHNFIRLWAWEQSRWAPWSSSDTYLFDPLPFARSSVCCALDGGNKFDLTKYNPAYFERLRERVASAQADGIYVSVMLFEGSSISTYPNIDPTWLNAWPGNPYNGANNVNGVDATDSEGSGFPAHEPNPAVWPYQKAYIDHVVDTVNRYGNVLYEVDNEDQQRGEAATRNIEWQNQVVDEVHNYEAHRYHRNHPAGITSPWGSPAPVLLGTHADWISPPGGAEQYNPATGQKVIIWDTDHITGQALTIDEAWKAFTRGDNVISMEHKDCGVNYIDPEDGVTPPDWRSSCADRVQGDMLSLAEQLPLNEMIPHEELCSSSFCMAWPGHDYVAYQPEAGATLTVSLPPGRYSYRWLDAEAHNWGTTQAVLAGHKPTTLTPPVSGPAVLHLWRGGGHW